MRILCLNEAARNIQGFLSHHKMTVWKAPQRSPASIRAWIDIVWDGGKSISSGRSSVVVSIKGVQPLADKANGVECRGNRLQGYRLTEEIINQVVIGPWHVKILPMGTCLSFLVHVSLQEMLINNGCNLGLGLNTFLAAKKALVTV